MMLDNFGVSEGNWRDAIDHPAPPTSLSPSRPATSGAPSSRWHRIPHRPEMAPEVGQLRSARARVWVHGPRRLPAGHLAIQRGDPRARPPGGLQGLSV